MSFTSQLNWRFATKSFDPEKKVSEQDLQKILDAIRLSPSSFGLQPFHVEVVTSAKLKDQLKEVSWNQPQVTDCSHYLVFSARTDVNERIEQYLELMSGGDEQKRSELEGFANMMRGFAESRTEEWLANWAGKQAYIAIGFAMAACAELEIDSCPMEGLDAKKYDEILQHPDHLKTVITLAIGYRKEEPARGKVRFPEEELISKHQ